MPKRRYNKPIFINEHTESPLPPKIYKYGGELRELIISDDISISERVLKLREAGDIHREARKYAQSMIKPGVKIYDLCSSIDAKIREICKRDDMEKGIAFPVGLSINSCAAHDSAVPNDDRIIETDDVVKIDIGTHVSGNIVDSAFTVAFKPKYTPLLKATYDATWTGIKMAGSGVLIDDISQTIQEVIESYEIDLDGKGMKPLRSITNLGGHTIEPYTIHAGKLMLGGIHTKCNKRMEEGECWAIETFATTSTSPLVKNGSGEVSHYGVRADRERTPLSLNITKKLYGHLLKTRSTLPFCTRWVDEQFSGGYRSGLKELVTKGIIESYPPLMSTPESYTSQFEHTIYLHEFGKEVVSFGTDY